MIGPVEWEVNNTDEAVLLRLGSPGPGWIADVEFDIPNALKLADALIKYAGRVQEGITE